MNLVGHDVEDVLERRLRGAEREQQHDRLAGRVVPEHDGRDEEIQGREKVPKTLVERDVVEGDVILGVRGGVVGAGGGREAEVVLPRVA